MKRRRSATLATALLAASSCLGGCAVQRLSQADLSRQADCSAQADRRYDKQNRYLLSEADQSGTPFSSSGVPGDTTAGLSDLYHRDRAVDDCMHEAAPVSTDTTP